MDDQREHLSISKTVLSDKSLIDIVVSRQDDFNPQKEGIYNKIKRGIKQCLMQLLMLER